MSEGDKRPELEEPPVGRGPQAAPNPGSPREPGEAPVPAEKGGASSPDEALPEIDDEMAEVLDEADMKDLLRAALAPPPGSVAPSILPGVQKKLRRRSRGKFYGDGWSTARAPRSTYLVTSLVMLALIAFVFFVLIPWGGGALP